MVEQNKACKVFADTTEPIRQECLLDIEVINAAHYLLDEMTAVFPVNSNESLYGNKDSLSPYPYIIETSCSDNRNSRNSGLMTNISKVSILDLSYKDDDLGVSETNSPSLPKLRFNPQVFDPGTLPLSKQEAYENQLYCISSELLLHYSQVYVRCKRPFVDFHTGALAQMCTAYDQAAQTLNNGYDIGVENANICFTAAVMPFRAHRDCSSKSLFEGENFMFMFMSNYLYFWTWFLDSLEIELSLVRRTGSRIHLLSPLKANFKGVDGPLMFMFDTWSTDVHVRSWHLRGCVSITRAIAMWVAKVLLCFKPGSLYNDCDHSLNRDIQSHVLFGAKVMFVVKMISFRILFSDGCIDSLGLACNSGTWLCLLVLLGDRLAWDPGICAISVHILEGKDGFKRVGKRIVTMSMIRSMRDGQIKIRHQAMNEKWCFLVEVLDKFGLYIEMEVRQHVRFKTKVISWDNSNLCSCGVGSHIFYRAITTDCVITNFRGHNSVVNAKNIDEYSTGNDHFQVNIEEIWNSFQTALGFLDLF